VDVATLAELLRETAERHDRYEKTHAEHHWWDWYAPYLVARQQGRGPEEAAAAADRHMEEAHQVIALRAPDGRRPAGDTRGNIALKQTGE